MKIFLNPLLVRKVLYRIAGTLVACGIITRLLFHFNKSPAAATISFLFNLDEEHNIPAIFSFLQLLFAGVLLACIAIHSSDKKDPLRRYWWLMTFLFFYIAIDELESIHEMSNAWFHQHFHTTGLLHFAWIIPALFFLLVLSIILFKFLSRLPSLSRKRFLLAGIVYVVGAVGGDAIAGQYISIHGNGLGWPYVLEYHIEEAMEMFSISYFIWALLLHIRDRISPEITFRTGK